jgi:probable rRNA maturation factor
MPPADSTVLYRALPSNIKFSAVDKRALIAFARKLAIQITPGQSFACLVTDDRALQELNRHFLGRDYPTDVLSFPPGRTGIELGDLAISIERAAAQSLALGHSLVDEIRILMLHGLLHLTGLDHERDRGEMARAERKWQATFSLPPVLITRSAATRRLSQETR